MAVGTMTKTTRENIAACAAHGFYFWSDHPSPATVWATDDNQRWHTVRIRRKDGKAEHNCDGYDHFTSHCRGSRSVEAYDIPANMAEAAELMGLDAEGFDDRDELAYRFATQNDTNEGSIEELVAELDAQPTVQPRRARPATVVASLLNHDPTWMVPFSDTELHSALGLTRHDHAIRIELDRRREAS
jgi:hypothetical protein